MAKYECGLTGDFQTILQTIDKAILSGSVSASYEDGSDFSSGGIRCAVRVYERYSMAGSNRVSLNVTLFSDGSNISLSAITSGGSQATFFKINTIGEETFLNQIIKSVAAFER